MPQAIMLTPGDIIEYTEGHKARITKIRIISSGEFVTQCKHDGNGDDVILTLDDGQGIINFWLKDRVVHKMAEAKR